jgi:hypothetical protein
VYTTSLLSLSLSLSPSTHPTHLHMCPYNICVLPHT